MSHKMKFMALCYPHPSSLHTGCDFAAAHALRGDARADELGEGRRFGKAMRLLPVFGGCVPPRGSKFGRTGDGLLLQSV